MSYSEKERSSGPKKLLALDGGGIRGVITLDSTGHVKELSDIGKALAQRDLNLDPFKGFL